MPGMLTQAIPVSRFRDSGQALRPSMILQSWGGFRCSGRLWARTVGVIAGLVTLARLVLVGALEPTAKLGKGR